MTERPSESRVDMECRMEKGGEMERREEKREVEKLFTRGKRWDEANPGNADAMDA